MVGSLFSSQVPDLVGDGRLNRTLFNNGAFRAEHAARCALRIDRVAALRIRGATEGCAEVVRSAYLDVIREEIVDAAVGALESGVALYLAHPFRAGRIRVGPLQNALFVRRAFGGFGAEVGVRIALVAGSAIQAIVTLAVAEAGIDVTAALASRALLQRGCDWIVGYVGIQAIRVALAGLDV